MWVDGFVDDGLAYRYGGLFDALGKMMKEGGVGKLYRGIIPNVIGMRASSLLGLV